MVLPRVIAAVVLLLTLSLGSLSLLPSSGLREQRQQPPPVIQIPTDTSNPTNTARPSPTQPPVAVTLQSAATPVAPLTPTSPPQI